MGVSVSNVKGGIVSVAVMSQQVLLPRMLFNSGFRMCCLVLMLLSAGAVHAVEPAEAWEGNWGVRMVIPSAAWPDLVTSWDPTAFSDQFTQLTSSTHVMVNVTHPANSTYYTSPNPPLVAAIPEMADRFPTRDVLGETLDEIDAAGKKAIVYFACEGFKADPTLGTLWMNYIASQGYTYNADGVREYLVKYYAETYGDKIDGWWFDGASEFTDRGGPNAVQLVKDAVHSGNPDAICAFGSDEGSDYFGGHPTLRTKADHWSYDWNYQTVTRIEAGPWLDTDKLPVANPSDGALGHIFSAMQANWTAGTLAFPAWQAADWCRRAVDAGGMFTWAIPLDVTEMLDPQFQLARLINTVIGGDEFIIESFETGFGDWIDGGANCSHYTGPYASHAAGAIKLTGNSSSSLMSTGDLPMNGSSTAAVDFGFYATGFGTGDTFQLQISTNGGAGYSTVGTWTCNTDFVNNEHNNDIKHLEGYSFNDQTRFRFRCYASGGSVYIDDIRVDAITTNPPPPLPVDPKPVFICDPIIKYYRNYAKEGVAYESHAGSPIITGSAVDGNGDTLTYSKVAGPAWLLVASNGYLSGTPLDGDVGINEFTVMADDGTGNTTNAQLIITVKPAPELLVHYEFNESSGSTASDSSGYGDDGTLQNMNNSDWVAGAEGNALDFDGVDDWVLSSNNDSFGTDHTWAAWIKTTGNGTIMAKAPQTGNWVQGGKTLLVENGVVKYDVGWVGSFEAGTIVNDGQWHHVALTVEFGTTDDIARIYIDGENKATQYRWNVDEYDDSGLVLKIGDTSKNFGPNFAGVIDDVRVYEGVMSGDEIALLAVRPSVYYDFNESSGSTASDAAGNGYDGTLQNMDDLDWVDGKLGNALDFDGSNDWVLSSYTASFNTDYTWAAWIKTTGSNGSIIAKSPQTGNWAPGGKALFVYGGKVRYDVGWVGYVEAPTIVNDGAWHHVAVTLQCQTDGNADTATIYIDGQPKASRSDKNMTGNDDTGLVLKVGDTNDDFSSNFAGLIDEVRVYDVVLGAAEIAELAAQTSNQPPLFAADPINETAAIEGADYSSTSSTIADNASDPDSDPMTFSKVSGPAWLFVAPDGTLSGIPRDSDVGENTFTVRVTDTGGLYDTAAMTIQVNNTYSGTQGMPDLLGFAAQWLTFDCALCGGANLDGINGVTLSDFSVLAKNWLADDLQLYLRFDDMTGDIAEDDSNYGRPGTLINSPTWSSGYSGGALDFDGASNYVEIPHDSGLDPDTDNWSVAFWMKSGIASQGAFIVSKRADAAPYTQYSIGLSEGNSYSWTAGSKLTFLFREAAGVEKGGFTTADIDVSDWTHVCVVLDRSTDTVYVYINGVSVPVTLDHDAALPTVNTTSPLYIGGNPDAGLYYQGLIDDVRIYDRALTGPEIQSVMN